MIMDSDPDARLGRLIAFRMRLKVGDQLFVGCREIIDTDYGRGRLKGLDEIARPFVSGAVAMYKTGQPDQEITKFLDTTSGAVAELLRARTATKE